MLAAEVVVGDVKRLHGLVVDPFFTEGIRQARITPVAHADGEVLAFHMAGADLLPASRVRITQIAHYPCSGSLDNKP